MITRRAMLATTLVLLGSLHLAGGALAGKAEIFTGATKGVAINGYDPVAYFTQEKPVAGTPAFTTSWKGATWRFSTSANQASFVKNPEKFAPQFGGYCAYAVSKGATAKTEPDAWTIVQGKLYLNYSKSVRTIWRKDVPGNIAKANANWPGVLK
ncbi:MAG: YHS domain-containing (seleno)protein [Alphaproteobacteria bacterium]